MSSCVTPELIGNAPRVLLCGSGPSLRDVDPWILDCPVIAVSTAIRSPHFRERRPHCWILCDELTDNHGDEGYAAIGDPWTLKVTPNTVNKRRGTNVCRPEYHLSENQDKHALDPVDKGGLGRRLLDGNLPLFYLTHKSASLAVQWLIYVGCSQIIFTGFDLAAGNGRHEKYCYGLQAGRNRNWGIQKSSLRHSELDFERLCRHRPPDVEFLSWHPREVKLDRLMPRLDHVHREPDDSRDRKAAERPPAPIQFE